MEQRFGRYRVTGQLGSGAMGQVYVAVDDVLGREVAIKTLRTAGGFTAHLLDDRFRQEARAIAQLMHPGVVQVFDLDLAADPPYLVMERVAGPSLAKMLDDKALGAAELVPLGIQVARALAAAHAAGVVHRDVKPANILAAGQGTWKLADFGVAHVPDSSLTITGQFVGSPAYAPPEALVKGVSAPAGDVYGLGATLYEAAAGSWPRAEKSGALFAPVPPLRELAPDLPPALCAAIDRACAFEADERPSAAELADLLANAEVERTSDVGPRASARSIPGGPKPEVRGPLLWRKWAVAGALVIAIVIVYFATRSSHHAPPIPANPAAALEDGPHEIRVNPPPGLNGHSAKDWNHIIEEIQRGHIEGAFRRLDDFERKYGATDETRSLREQLAAIPNRED